MIPLSVLDLAPIVAGASAADALRNTLDLARHVEDWGYRRFWLAEHHNIAGIASAATAVVIGHVAGGTRSIRVGAGGVMLPNHAPLVIAEQFGTLESLYPGRIDLGLGRAPGTDMHTAQALRRDLQSSAEQFPQDVVELRGYFRAPVAGQKVRAIPGAGLKVPLWLLGSSLFSAQLAGTLGLPFAFAAHFAPDAMLQALAIYRQRFQPSEQLERPYAMLGVNIIAADSDDAAQYLFTSLQQAFVHLRRGEPQPLAPPRDDMDAFWTPAEKTSVRQVLGHSIVGFAATVQHGLQALIAATGADEIMAVGQIHDHAARLRSFQITAQVRDALART